MPKALAHEQMFRAYIPQNGRSAIIASTEGAIEEILHVLVNTRSQIIGTRQTLIFGWREALENLSDTKGACFFVSRLLGDGPGCGWQGINDKKTHILKTGGCTFWLD